MNLYARILLAVIRPALDLHESRRRPAKRMAEMIRDENFERQLKAAIHAANKPGG